MLRNFRHVFLTGKEAPAAAATARKRHIRLTYVFIYAELCAHIDIGKARSPVRISISSGVREQLVSSNLYLDFKWTQKVWSLEMWC